MCRYCGAVVGLLRRNGSEAGENVRGSVDKRANFHSEKRAKGAASAWLDGCEWVGGRGKKVGN